MTAFATGDDIHGTPSGDRDASRPHIPHDPASPDQEKQHDGAAETSRVHSEAVAHVADDKRLEQRTVAEPTSAMRPGLASRKSTNVSIAAAPFGGTFCYEGEKVPGVAPAHRPRFSFSSSSSDARALRDLPDAMADASRVSTDMYGNTYPEGGPRAYLCVLGGFCGLMAAMGTLNTIGAYQTYLSTHQLRDSAASSVGWIFGIYVFLAFFGGLQIGPIFDAVGPRWLVLAGSVCLLLTHLLLGICTAYWHFVVVFGVLGGLGTSLIFTPAFAAVGHWFLRRRGHMTGLAAVGGSLGGIVFPLALQALAPRVGFAWATRFVALVDVVLLAVANLCIRVRLPPKPISRANVLPDLRIMGEPVFAFTTLGVFFYEWGLFVPLAYLSSYALAHGVPPALAYQLLAVLNAGSCLGRYLPGLAADRLGRYNAMVATTALGLVATLALWLPAADHVALIVAFALVFGFASGAGISLTPVCVGQLCRVDNYGRYYATCYTLVSFGSLTGIPIAGLLLGACGGQYWGVVVFASMSYAASLAALVTARGIGTGWKLCVVY